MIFIIGDSSTAWLGKVFRDLDKIYTIVIHPLSLYFIVVPLHPPFFFLIDKIEIVDWSFFWKCSKVMGSSRALGGFIVQFICKKYIVIIEKNYKLYLLESRYFFHPIKNITNKYTRACHLSFRSKINSINIEAHCNHAYRFNSPQTFHLRRSTGLRGAKNDEFCTYQSWTSLSVPCVIFHRSFSLQFYEARW